MKILNKHSILLTLSHIVYSSINEAFDFDNEIEASSDIIINSQDLKSIIIDKMDRAAITPKYVLTKVLDLNTSSVPRFATNLLKNITTKHICEENLVDILLYIQVVQNILKENNWLQYTYNESLNDNDISNIVYEYIKQLNDSSKITEQYFEHYQKSNIIFKSPDRGMVHITAPRYYQSQITSNNAFVFTGLIKYEKAKTLSNNDINTKIFAWLKKLLKDFIEQHPELCGLVVIQLGHAGKVLYDQLKTNKYKISNNEKSN